MAEHFYDRWESFFPHRQMHAGRNQSPKASYTRFELAISIAEHEKCGRSELLLTVSHCRSFRE